MHWVTGVLLLFGCGSDGSSDGGDADADVDGDSDSDSGDGPNIAGLYEVTHHTSALLDPDCVTEGNDRTEPPYFQVVESSSASGDPVFGFHPCTSADVSTCDGIDSLGYVDVPEADGWSSTLPYSRVSGADCELNFSTDRVDVAADASLHLEARRYGETVPVADGPCTAEEAATRGTDMPCESYEVLDGRPTS